MTVTKLVGRMAICFAAASVCSGCGVVDASTGVRGGFDRVLQVSGPVELYVRTNAGDVRVDTGTSETVRIVARIRANRWWSTDADRVVRQIEGAPPIEQTGNTIRIGQRPDDNSYRNVSISYDVTVPPATRVNAVVGSGGQTIRHVQGPVDAIAGSGGVRVVQVGGDVRVTAGSGGVRIEDAGGRLEARTGSGGIRIAGARGLVEARAGSGGVVIEGRPLDSWDVRTGSGGITVQVTGDAPFDVDARAGSGGVASDQSVTVVGERTRNRLQGTVRGGGARVHLETGSGGIRIH
jgi:Toastrack DUF4097